MNFDILKDPYIEGILYGLSPFIIILFAFYFLNLLKIIRIDSAVGCACFASLGLFLGIFTGASKEPVVAAILPAAVTTISTLLGYVFVKSKEADQTMTRLIPAFITMLCASATFGAFFAAEIRDTGLQAAEKTRQTQERNELIYNQSVFPVERWKTCRASLEEATCLSILSER